MGNSPNDCGGRCGVQDRFGSDTRCALDGQEESLAEWLDFGAIQIKSSDAQRTEDEVTVTELGIEADIVCSIGQRSEDPPHILQGQDLQEAHPA